jgi:hypothetical protein
VGREGLDAWSEGHKVALAYHQHPAVRHLNDISVDNYQYWVIRFGFGVTGREGQNWGIIGWDVGIVREIRGNEIPSVAVMVGAGVYPSKK